MATRAPSARAAVDGATLVQAVGAALALGLAAWALTWGFAALAASGPRAAIGAWERQGRAADAGIWQAARTRLERARALEPLNAAHSADLGRLHAWQAWRQADRAGAAAYRRRAAAYFREAVDRRPTWGVAWVSLAEMIVLSAGDRAQARRALARALDTAPGEPVVLERAVRLAMGIWEALDDPERRRVAAAYERLLASGHGGEALARTASAQGWDLRLRTLDASPAPVAGRAP